jgi:RimJ/RimL family protein N-acetyltransferase
LEAIGLDEVVSFTTPANVRSRRVMEKIGLSQIGEFDHPRLAVDSPLRRHVLYEISATEWRRTER